MLFPKRKRIVNRQIIEEIKSYGCVVSNIECISPIDAHHLTTVGAGGDDVAENLIPLCRLHHQLLHNIGTPEMAKRYIKVKAYLIYRNRHELLESKYEKKN